MKIFLLRLDQERHVFYSEGPETINGEVCDEEAIEGKRGVRAWLTAKLRTWKTAVHGTNQGLSGFIKKIWGWLQRFIGPDEPLLRGLRKARAIALHHPKSMSHEAARGAWFQYLQGRQRHHLFWLAVNLLISPVSVLMAPIPGPNFLGYWFVYRAVCHALALIGVRRARDRSLETTLIPNGLLNLSLKGADAQEVATLAAHCGLCGLDVFLVRLGATAEAEMESAADGPEEAPVGHRDD